MEVGGRATQELEPSTHDSRDAYTEVGGRATQEAKAEGEGRKRPEYVFESKTINS